MPDPIPPTGPPPAPRPDPPLPPLGELESVRLAAIVDSSDDAIVSKDLDGTVRSWNPAAERIFGYTVEEMIGNSIFRLIPPELHEEEHKLLARIRAGEHIAHFETDRVRKDGRRIRVSLTLSPMQDLQGRTIGASSIKRDVTRQRLLEIQLHQGQRMEAVGRLAGGIAHDFNNLLTVIGGLTGLTLQRLPEGSQERRNLEQVAEATERATALTQQLLTFGGRQMARVEPLDLNAIVVGLESLLRRLIGEHITLRVMLDHNLGRVRGNRAQIEQILMNLALNGRDAMLEGGVLTIQTENVQVNGHFAREQLRLTPGPYAVVSVSDAGEGMDAVTMANIFEPFFTTKSAGKGTGLGLATVYAIVQQAGGAIYVYSEPGRGSVFKVYFPRIELPVEIAADRPKEPGVSLPPATDGVILLVEDEIGVRSFAAQVLSAAGYKVIEAGSGAEALEVAAGLEAPLALLLTDVVMPEVNGRVLADRLHAVNPNLPVLYTSGYTDDMILRAGVMTEDAAFLQKPFTPQVLLERVRAMLTQAPQSAE